jgi:hypothetical protein
MHSCGNGVGLGQPSIEGWHSRCQSYRAGPVQLQLADEINVFCESAAAVLRYKLHVWYLLRG